MTPEHGRKHRWTLPPPGTGNPATQRVCALCGVRYTRAIDHATGDETPCTGRDAGSVAETIHDYDPYVNP